MQFLTPWRMAVGGSRNPDACDIRCDFSLRNPIGRSRSRFLGTTKGGGNFCRTTRGTIVDEAVATDALSLNLNDSWLVNLASKYHRKRTSRLNQLVSVKKFSRDGHVLFSNHNG